MFLRSYLLVMFVGECVYLIGIVEAFVSGVLHVVKFAENHFENTTYFFELPLEEMLKCVLDSDDVTEKYFNAKYLRCFDFCLGSLRLA